MGLWGWRWNQSYHHPLDRADFLLLGRIPVSICPTPSQTIDMHGGAGGVACVVPVSRREALSLP
jgi:hypothetical protein